MCRLLIVLVITSFGCREAPIKIILDPISIESDALLQAISIVDESNAWVSGHQATLARTVDGGSTWDIFEHKVDTLQFRDVHGIDRNQAVVMSAGPGSLSRIFLFSADSGFQETYLMPYDQGFLNTIEFWDDQQGLAFGDSFEGELFMLRTEDGGRSWTRIPPDKLPEAGDGEGGFAASGTCVATKKGGKAWIGTGAGGNSRILFTEDFGTSWKTFDVPMVKGPSAGITSIRMLDDSTGAIVGGDLTITDTYTPNVAFTRDGGRSWQLTTSPITTGAFYGSELIEANGKVVLIACGPNGMDFTTDFGLSWKKLSSQNFWAVSFHSSGTGFASGPEGQLVKLTIL